MDNARIKKKVINLIKQNNLVLFTFPPYFPELNKIENTLGRNKHKSLLLTWIVKISKK